MRLLATRLRHGRLRLGTQHIGGRCLAVQHGFGGTHAGVVQGHLRPQHATVVTHQHAGGAGAAFGHQAMALEIIGPGHLRQLARVVQQHLHLAHVGREDQHLAVLLNQVFVNRHMQHDVGRAVAHVVPAPNHVAQVIVHFFAGIKRQQRQLELHLPGQPFGQGHVQARHVVAGATGEGRVVFVQRHLQCAVGFDFCQVRQLGLRLGQRDTQGH